MIYLIFISVYLIALIALGAWKSVKIKTQEDFSVAGRSLSPWILVGTMLATWIGTGSILGNAGKTFSLGLSGIWLPLGGVLGIIILTRIAAKARDFGSLTVPEILGTRYGNTARILSVISLVTAYMVIVSYQYNAGGAVLSTVLTDSAGNSMITKETGTIVAAVFIIAYTLLAGLVSVAYTDVANGIIMFVSLVIAFPVLYFKAGGLNGMEVTFANLGKSNHMQAFGVLSYTDVINFCLPSFLLILGDANMYQRFFASKNSGGAKKATTLLIFAVLFIEILIILTSWVSSSLVTDPSNGRHLLIYAAHQFLPPVVGAIMLTTIVGIIISTADSYLLVPATSLIRDVYMKYINPNANQKHIVLVSRILVLALGTLAYYVSLQFAKSATFFTKSLYAYTIYGASITPSLVAAFFWKRATKQGAVLSILSGFTMTLLWKEFPNLWSWLPQSFYKSIDEVLPAIVVSVLMLIVGSLLSPKPKTAIQT